MHSKRIAEQLPAPEVLLPMRRNGFDLAPDLLALRDQDRVTRVPTPFGDTAWPITRYEDVRTVLSDPTRFGNAGPVPGFEQASDEQRAVTTGNLLGVPWDERDEFPRRSTRRWTSGVPNRTA